MSLNRMTRREFGRRAAGLAGAAGLFGAAPRGFGTSISRPNILLLLTDDQSAHLASLGTPGIDTPATDGLAEGGTMFRHAFSTCASCSPARSGLLTGMAPHSNGHWRNTITPTIPGNDIDFTRESTIVDAVGVHEDIPTLIEILNNYGYYTGITQKFHLSPPWKYWFAHRLGVGNQPSQHYSKATEFLAAAGSQPFFLLANIGNTHRPFAAHIAGIGLPSVSPDDIAVPPELPDTPAMRADLAEYFTTVEHADACAAQILRALEESGRAAETLVIFSSDQGYCYHRAKATAYDDGLRVPLIVKGLGVRPGVELDQLVSHIDLMPTILDYAGIDVPDRVHGRSLRPLLEGDAGIQWRDVVFAEHNSHGPNPLEYYPIRSACDGRYHYLRNLTPERTWDGVPEDLIPGPPPPEVLFAGPADAFPGGPWDNHSFEATVDARLTHPAPYAALAGMFARPAEELYDLEADPGELTNLAGDPAHAARLAELRAAVDAWMAETDDPGVETRNVPRRTESSAGRRLWPKL